MSDFLGINQFGSLTVNGTKVKFEDIDTDKNGEISEQEYNNFLNEVKLDSIEFSSVDKDGDKVISESEFTLYDQKSQMQDAINDMAGTISQDFAGKSEYLTDVSNALKDYIEEYAANYTGEVENMAEDFKAALPLKYDEIKAGIMANDPATVKSAVLDDLYSNLTAPQVETKADGTTVSGEALPEGTANRIIKELEAEANKFIKEYKGENLNEDLRAHLEEFMNKSDVEKLQDATNTFNAGVAALGSYIDSGADLTTLKELSKEFLLACIDKGVTVKLGGTTIKTEAAINTALRKFSDGAELKAAMDEVISGLSTSTLQDGIIAEEEQKAAEAAEKAFTGIKGSEYQVNTSLIDYSSVSGYFNGSQITTKGADNHDNNIRNSARSIIEQSNLKEQMKQQITDMLASKGISFDKIADVFENVYNDSLNQSLNEITSRKTNHKWRKKKQTFASNQSIKDIVDNFINKFNTNIATAIDQMNASTTDMDLQDVNFTEVVATDENGNVTDPVLANALEKNTTVSVSRHRDDEYVSGLIDRMQSTMLGKAKTMCDANGIEFDLTVFNTMFNNAKSIAVNSDAVSNSFFKTRVNPQVLLTTFTTNFKETYTTWVQAQVAGKSEEN